MKILDLKKQAEENDKLIHLNQLLLNGKYDQIIKSGDKYIRKFPGQSFFYTILSISYSQLGEFEKALEILRRAEKNFPEDYEVLFQLAKVNEDLEKFDEALDYYDRSVKCTPSEYKDAISDCLNDMGALKYRLGFKEEAIEYWERSLEADPSNEKARSNINYFDKGISTVNSDYVFYQYKVFEEIQTNKYYSEKGISKFKNKAWKKKFLLAVENAWIRKVMPDMNLMEEYDDEELEEWYESIEIEDPEEVKKPDSPMPELDKDTMELLNKTFSFLPEDGIVTAIAAGPALNMEGIDDETIAKMIKGVRKISGKDKEVLIWAYDIGKILIEIAIAGNRKKTDKLIDRLIETMRIRLEDNDVKIVLRRMIDTSDKKKR